MGHTMKITRRSSVLCLTLLVLALGGIAAVPVKPLRLLWDYAAEDLNTNLVFLLRGTTNLAQPMPWPIEAVIPTANHYSNGVWNVPTNGPFVTFEVLQAVTPGQHFYYVTASNAFWEAESLPSNTLGLDPLPSQSGNLRAKKGW